MIRHEQLRLIDEAGTQLGVVSASEALSLAMEKGLDLVEISPNAHPPVCKIIDYGKYKYEQSKREKDNKKKQHVVSIKTIRIMSVNIDTNDLQIKANMAKKFLEEGDKVKVFLQYRGREIVHKDLGKELMMQFFEMLNDVAKLDKPIEAEGAKRIAMVLAKK